MSEPAPASRQVRIRPVATADMQQIVRYLDQHSATAADRFLAEFGRAVNLLVEMPNAGAIRTRSGRLSGVRSWPLSSFGPYLVFYLPMASGIEVIRVLHGSRDIAYQLRNI